MKKRIIFSSEGVGGTASISFSQTLFNRGKLQRAWNAEK